MLQTIRDKTQGWFASLLIGAICITFALWGVHYYLQSDSSAQTYAAKVNGQIISQDTFNKAFQQVQAQQKELLGADYSNDPAFQRTLHAQVLQQLIQQTLLNQVLAKTGFAVPREAVDETIISFPAFQEGGVFSQARFNQVLQQMGLTETQFYNQLTSQLLAAQLGMGVTNSNYALPLDLKASIMLINETRDLGYLILSPENFVQTTPVSDADIQAYYDQHLNDFKMPAQIQVAYLILPPHHNDVDKLADLTYEHPENLQYAADKLGLTIQTTDFFDRQTKPKTGLLSETAVLNAAFEDDVYKKGYNSDPISLADGSTVVLRVLNKKPMHILLLSEVNEKIRHLLLAQAQNEALMKQANQLAAALGRGEKGETLAQNNQIVWHEQTNVNRHQEKVNPKVLLTVFNMYVPQDRQHPTTAIIPIADNKVAVVAFYQANYGDFDKASSAQLKIFNQKISADYGRADYALYLRSLMKKAEIHLNNKESS